MVTKFHQFPDSFNFPIRCTVLLPSRSIFGWEAERVAVPKPKRSNAGKRGEKAMSSGEFREGMDSIGGFIEKIVKVMKDLYLFIKTQLENFKK